MSEQQSSINVLLIEDNTDDVVLIQNMLREADGPVFTLSTAGLLSEGLALLKQGGVDVALLDLGLPDCDGLDTLSLVASHFAGLPILVLTGQEAEWMGVQAVQRGAQDYLIKDRLDAYTLIRAIRYAMERQHRLHDQRARIRRVEASHMRLQNVLQQNTEAILLVNGKGRVFYHNPAAHDLLDVERGAEADEVLGRPIKAPSSEQFEVEHAERGPVTVDMRVVEIDWAGEPARLVTLSDITERAALHEALAGAAEEWQSTFDAVEDMVVVINQDHIVLRANRAARENLGDGRAEGMKCFELFHGAEGHPDNCPSCKTFETAKAAHVERQEEHLGGRWLDMASYPIKDRRGEVAKVVHVVRDITERKTTEQMQRSLEAKTMVLRELEQISEMKGQFIEVVSHELRTPMTVIRSGVGLLLDNSLGSLNEKQHKFLGIIEKNIDRLSRFATDVLSLSRLDSGRYQLLPAQLDLVEDLGPTVDLLRTRAEEGGFELTLDFDRETPLPLYADADAVGQVLTNLVSNVIMHCPAGTDMTLSVRRADDHNVGIALADNGPGIPQQDRERIFERFFQSGRQSGPGYKGTGIGLAVCKSLVERMDGTLRVDSEEGEGTTFTITLPTDSVDEEFLFGKLAVIHGLVEPKDLQQALEVQRAEKAKSRKIGEILQEKGVMTPDQVEETLRRQRASLARPHPYLPSTVGQSLLGQMAVKYGYVTDDQLNRCIFVQQRDREAGRRTRLGEVLVGRGLMSTEQILQLLRLQKHDIVLCHRCATQYNIISTDRQQMVRCPECGEPLVGVDGPQSVGVLGDA